MAKSYSDKVVSAKQAISSAFRGKRVFIGTYCGEPQHLLSTLIEHTDFSNVEVVRFLNLEGSLIGLVADDTQERCDHVRSIYQDSGLTEGWTRRC